MTQRIEHHAFPFSMIIDYDGDVENIKCETLGAVINRDGYKCTECFCGDDVEDPNDSDKLVAYRLVVHTQFEPDDHELKSSINVNDPKHYITLCPSCHDEKHTDINGDYEEDAAEAQAEKDYYKHLGEKDD